MKKLFFLLFVLVVLAGCKSEPEIITPVIINVSENITEPVNETENVTEEVEVEKPPVKKCVTDLPLCEDTKLLEIHFIDVGHGDSILVFTPNGKSMLIDGGFDDQGAIVTQYLRDFDIIYDNDLDVLIATHPDKDHVGGLDTLLFNMAVKNVYDNGQKVFHNSYINYVGLAKKNPYNVVEEDMALDLDEDLEIELIVPYDRFGYSENTNDNSILTKITYGDVSFLLTGDCTRECQKNVFDADLDVDVLKIPHHGDSDGLPQFFLDLTTPEIAVISTGESLIFNHPHQEVIEKLNKTNITTYRTDLNGTIIVRSDGKNFDVLITKEVEDG
jgi:beta-lactamase superfamily II metal-dependent hydrolase